MSIEQRQPEQVGVEKLKDGLLGHPTRSVTGQEDREGCSAHHGREILRRRRSACRSGRRTKTHSPHCSSWVLGNGLFQRLEGSFAQVWVVGVRSQIFNESVQSCSLANPCLEIKIETI